MKKRLLLVLAVLTGMFLLSASIVWAASPGLVAKTGQTTSYSTGDDGDLEVGVPIPSPRFTDNTDGTVTDNLTGLVWLKNASCWPKIIWSNAVLFSNGLESGMCGLTDGSVAGDWRLPNRFELESLLNLEKINLALPVGHPFTNMPTNSFYWSSTTKASSPNAWGVYFYYGSLFDSIKSSILEVWPVRGPDTDSDGILDYTDNCPDDCNTQQLDTDNDTIGDVCDPEPGDCGGCAQNVCEIGC